MPPTGSGSLESLRERNRRELLDTLRRHGSASRADLARLTGLSRTTVSTLVADLQASGMIVERNVMERSWQQAQSGYAVLFTVRNQDGACPWCQVEQVTFTPT